MDVYVASVDLPSGAALLFCGGDGWLRKEPGLGLNAAECWGRQSLGR